MQDVTVGMLGHGAIGARVAADLAALRFQIKVWNRSAKPMPAGIAGFHGRDGLKAMQRETEILVNLLPLTAKPAASSYLPPYFGSAAGGHGANGAFPHPTDFPLVGRSIRS